MSKWSQWRLAAACIATALTACGGGASDPSVSVSIDRTSLQFVGIRGQASTDESLRMTIKGGNTTYYGAVVADVPSAFQATFTPTSDTTATVTVTPIPGVATTGQRTGSITFKLCTDQYCNSVAWSQSVPYTQTTFSIDASTVNLSAYEGTVAPTQTISITPPDSSGLLSVRANAANGGNWLTASRTSGERIDLNANGVGLMAGSYAGTVTLGLAAQASSSLLQIPVSLSVGTGLIMPPIAPVDVTVDASAATLRRSVPIAFQGTQSPLWTASSDQPWLVLGASGGLGQGELPFSIDLSKQGRPSNWTSASGRITIQAQGLSASSFEVVVNMRIPEVHWVSGNAIPTGRPSSIRVFGRGFTQLQDASRLFVAGAPGVGRIISDTEAMLDLSPQLPGLLKVEVRNAAALPARTAGLGARALNSLSSMMVRTIGEPRSAFFDPARNAVYAVNLSQNTLVRARLLDGNWVVDGLPISEIGDMAMGPDRETLYVSSGPSNLLELNPDTLQIKTTHKGTFMSSGSNLTKGLAMTRDLRLWFGGSQWSSGQYFDLQSNTLKVEPSAGSMYSPKMFSSGDGSRMVVSQNGISPSRSTVSYWTEAGIFSQSLQFPEIYYSAVYSEDGSRVLLDDTAIHDGSTGALIGSVQISGAINLGSVLSPDGRRVYTLVTTNNNTLNVDHVDVYDATRVEPGTSRLVKLGQVAVSSQSASCGLNPPYGCGVRGVFFISPLGDTLFWMGNSGLQVIPVPPTLSSVLQAPSLKSAVIR